MRDPHSDELFKGLSPEDAEGIRALASPASLDAGATLFTLGQQADAIFLVVRGRILLTLPMQIRGEEKDILVEERLPGETAGWSGLIPPHRFTLQAKAAMDSEVLAFSRDRLLDFFARRPAAGYTLTRNVAAVIGHRLQVFQTMWLREMQRVVELSDA